MTKEEAKQKLKKNGYVVVEDNSVVTVLIPPGTSMKNTIKDIKEKLNGWGYNCSFGVKQQKGAENLNEEEIEEDEIELDSTDEEISDVGDTEEVISEAIEETADENGGTVTTEDSDDDDEYYDEEDSDMLLTEDSIQFSLEDFGLDF